MVIWGVDCGSGDSIRVPSTISGWLLAVVDSAGLGGLVFCTCSGSSIAGVGVSFWADGAGWDRSIAVVGVSFGGVGAGRSSVAFLKTLSNTKSGPFELLPHVTDMVADPSLTMTLKQ
ncbi:hypothetical protein Tco_0291045 [Tanacetum coccineum]